MSTDVVAYIVVGCFAIFLLAAISVTVKGIISEWLDYRRKVREAYKKRK